MERRHLPPERRPRLHRGADLAIAVALTALDALMLVSISGLVALAESDIDHAPRPAGPWTPVAEGLAALGVTAAVCGLFAYGLRRLHAPIAATLQALTAAAVVLAGVAFGIAEYGPAAAASQGMAPAAHRLLP